MVTADILDIMETLAGKKLQYLCDDSDGNVFR